MSKTSLRPAMGDPHQRHDLDAFLSYPSDIPIATRAQASCTSHLLSPGIKTAPRERGDDTHKEERRASPQSATPPPGHASPPNARLKTMPDAERWPSRSLGHEATRELPPHSNFNRTGTSPRQRTQLMAIRRNPPPWEFTTTSKQQQRPCCYESTRGRLSLRARQPNLPPSAGKKGLWAHAPKWP